jgi:hypothetical protein
MKTILLTFFFFVCLSSHSQTTDIIYLPKEKSLITSLRYGFTPIGFYAGGYLTKDFPFPFTYTTPLSIINRVGITLTGSQNRWGVMLGTKIENYKSKREFKPDIWINFYPLRTIFNTPNGLDFVFSVNYQTKVTYGVGISATFGGIY